MADLFTDKTVLVTGGTGSFGHAVVEELLRFKVKEVRIFSRDEEKQLDMQRELEDSRLRFMVGDVRDFERVLEAVQGVDILYHAAALKVIPTCEQHCVEAIKTNINGSLNVKRAALIHGVSKSLLISTDKAVKPVNLYGMTKAVAEKIWVADSSDTSKFSIVRYGNVVGSRGSIVPFFKKLLQEKKPLPITDRNMTRFWITLRQATELVFYATEQMRGGEIFVPKISACKVVDMARAMGAYNMKVVGVRPGEKLHECLINEYEILNTVIARGSEYYVVRQQPTIQPVLNDEYTSSTARHLSVKEIGLLLKEDGWI